MTTVLALDTTGAHCAVAVARDGQTLAHISERLGRGHAERLAPMVGEALDQADLSPTDIDRVAVCTGPGSFTGQRVGISFALGFALPRGLPVLGVDALTLEAEKQCRAGDALAGFYRDIKRGEVMYALFSHGKPLDPLRATTLEAAENDVDTYQAALYEAEVADMALLADLAADLDPKAYPPEPVYSRGPDAKLPGGRSPDARQA